MRIGTASSATVSRGSSVANDRGIGGSTQGATSRRNGVIPIASCCELLTACTCRMMNPRPITSRYLPAPPPSLMAPIASSIAHMKK